MCLTSHVPVDRVNAPESTTFFVATHCWWRGANFLCVQLALIPLYTLPQFIVPFVFPAHANYQSISATACLFVCSLARVCPTSHSVWKCSHIIAK